MTRMALTSSWAPIALGVTISTHLVRSCEARLVCYPERWSRAVWLRRRECNIRASALCTPLTMSTFDPLSRRATSSRYQMPGRTNGGSQFDAENSKWSMPYGRLIGSRVGVAW